MVVDWALKSKVDGPRVRFPPPLFAFFHNYDDGTQKCKKGAKGKCTENLCWKGDWLTGPLFPGQTAGIGPVRARPKTNEPNFVHKINNSWPLDSKLFSYPILQKQLDSTFDGILHRRECELN